MNTSHPTYVRNDNFTGRTWVPAVGSREHFFHFLIGYLLPLVHAQQHCHFNEFLVLDCGPLMTPILGETLSLLNFKFEIVPPRAIKNPYYLEAWDHGWNSTEAVRKTVCSIYSAYQDYACDQTDCPLSENLLIERSPSHGYYIQGAAEIPGYGISRRGITNFPEIQDVLISRGIDHARYEPGRHSLGCQISSFRHARRIVGMRGAEWANTIWSQPGLRVRVLYPPYPPVNLLTGFLNRTGVHYEIALVTQPFAPENPLEVVRFLTEP